MLISFLVTQAMMLIDYRLWFWSTAQTGRCRGEIVHLRIKCKSSRKQLICSSENSCSMKCCSPYFLKVKCIQTLTVSFNSLSRRLSYKRLRIIESIQSFLLSLHCLLLLSFGFSIGRFLRFSRILAAWLLRPQTP